MATVGEQLVAALTADATVSSLVASRIYPVTLPEGVTLPAITYQVVSDVPQNSTDGTTSTRLKQARVQIDCYARAGASGGGYLGAHAVADAVENVVGNLTAPGFNGILDRTDDLFDNETEYFRVSMDFFIWH